MALNKDKALKGLVKELEKNYLLQRACNKLGLTRSTVYRWMEEGPEFASSLRGAQLIGRRYMSDYVESKLLKNIENQEQRAIEFWLKSNNDHYRSREKALDRKVDTLTRELKESRAIVAAVGKESLLRRFVDWGAVRNYMRSPERRKIQKLLNPAFTGHTPEDKEALARVQQIMSHIKLAEYVARADNIPEEYIDLVD